MNDFKRAATRAERKGLFSFYNCSGKTLLKNTLRGGSFETSNINFISFGPLCARTRNMDVGFKKTGYRVFLCK